MPSQHFDYTCDHCGKLVTFVIYGDRWWVVSECKAPLITLTTDNPKKLGTITSV